MKRHTIFTANGRPRVQPVCGLAVLALLGLAAGPLVADDTELFATGFDTPAACEAPNVVFLIDTSGSMDTRVRTQVDWDPQQTFAGCFDSDDVYWSQTGELPDCSTDRSFPKSANRCASSADDLDSLGSYRNLFRVWDPARERWEVLQAPLGSAPVECEADRGIDGNGADTYAADGADGPWAGTAATEPAWASATNATLFDGNWLNWNTSPTVGEKTRLEVVQDVTTAVIDSVEDLNVAVMRFNFDEGGPVIHAMENLGTARESTKTAILGLQADGFTPLSEALYEAGQYLAQRNVDYGNVGPELSTPNSRLGADPNGASYNSPLTSPGQKTYIVLLTDGEPNRDDSADTKITGLPEFSTLVGADCDGSGQGRCLDDMAEYLFKKDLRPNVPGTQNVITHTIGFTLDLDLLESTATRGGGRYFTANDTASLTAVLTELAESFVEDGNLFTAPAIPVNAFDRTAAGDEVFVSVFAASNTVRWPGNLKKYRLDVQAGDQPEDPATIQLVDRFGASAVDPATGFFMDGTTSFWSSVADGNQVELGGAASRLPDPGSRLLLSNLSSNDLNAPGGQNAVTVANGSITAAGIGAPADQRDAVIEWARGRDVLDEDNDGNTSEARLSMGDPLHSRPVVVTWGGTASNPDSTVFVTTNEGLLHAFDTDTGDELWAFLPQRLLGRLYGLYSNNPAATRDYGLDGEITVHIKNDDGQPGIRGSERVILLFGMRRGGDGVFAIDVTDRNRPQLLWEIDSATPGFSSLGQTWSRPLVRRLQTGGSERRVVMFAGGYDTGQDNRNFREDNVGNAIFIVDLDTGQRLWSAGNSSGHNLRLDRMRYSIPAALETLDLDGDGRPDRMYVGDMGGQLWRFDIINGNPAASLVEGGVIASLGGADQGGNPPASAIRRFYTSVDAVPVLTDRRLYISLNIGSGYRAHPLDTTADERFFAVRDFKVFEVVPSDSYPEPLTIDDLVDVTNDANPLLGFSDAGWHFGLVNDSGEKVLTDATTFADVVFFTSFAPAGTGNACAPAGGRNRLYAVGVRDGSPQTNFDQPENDDPELTTADRSMELAQGGIAPEASFLFPAGAGTSIVVGVEQIPIIVDDAGGDGDGSGGGRKFGEYVPSYWLEREGP